MKQTSLASRYARALAGAVGEKSALESTAEELDAFSRLYETSKDLRDFLLNPAIPVASRAKGIAALSKRTRVSARAARLLEILLSRGRMGLLPEVSREFRRVEEEILGMVSVELTTARPLTAPEVKRVQASLEKFTGKKVRLAPKVDAEILGGARAKIGSLVYDGTVANRLDKLKRQLIGEK
jgi:F-type H+-transporting ATPase subunit delta